ncbi:hypothetical protein UFOVP713_70 [uncultured Caudovirales phage]|jgi:hypothetical protein|uniref:Uncharacterized protein n=1 Tax=uncultured Caudovirales phage TaxID=2100421 RepID=A0A6J5NPJ3_9CAUD|nr:hypothetical protein UFOVP713_70 [uncultured Caudovirales phage]
MNYKIDYYDGDEDRLPCWVVLERVGDGVYNVVERCANEFEAESFARAYNAIAIYEADPY